MRVHSDGPAAASARSIHARAYTAGSHVVFASNAYAPNSPDGQRLIAHELTHVLQQTGGSTDSAALVQRNKDDDLTRDWVRDLKEYVATHPTPYKHVIEIIRFARKYDLDDNVAADFAASQPLTQLENYGSTAEGREMLDVLINAMMTGSVSDYEKVQADKIRYAKWKTRPAELYKIVDFRDPEIPKSPLDGIINKGADELKSFVFGKRYKDAINIIREAGDLDDDIASRFLTTQSPDRLEAYAANSEGRAMLDVLYQALVTGDVTGFERLQADRILLAKAKTGKAPTTADVAKALDPPIFPLETSWGSTATIWAGLSDGKVKVYYDSRTGLGGSEFKTEREALYSRYDEKIYTGIRLDTDELVTVKLFDQGGALMTVPAIQLIDFFNQQKQDTLGKIKMVSVMAATVGLGGVGAPGVLGWADTIAFATQAGNLIIQANRDVIAKTALGRDFLKAWDVAVKVSEYYGYVRMGVDGLRLVHATVVNPLKLWREEVQAGLNSAEREGIASVQQKADEWADTVKQAETDAVKQAEAAKAEAAGATKTETTEAAKAGPAGSQSATGISRPYPTNEDEILALNRARRRARPAYAKDPVPRRSGGPRKAGSSKPKTGEISSETAAAKPTSAPREKAGSADVETATPSSAKTAPEAARTPRQALEDKYRGSVDAARKDLDDIAATKLKTQNRLRDINNELATARGERRLELLKQRENLKTFQNELGSSADLVQAYLEAKSLLKGASQEHYLALTKTAQAHPDFMAVAELKIDNVFGTTGRPVWVEHVYPRSRIYSKPGFARLSVDDQAAIFSYGPNLKSIPADLNRLRSNTPYAELVHNEAMHQLGASASKIEEMAQLEKRMETAIDAMIADPTTIPKWREP